jgi:hypothetical protein
MRDSEDYKIMSVDEVRQIRRTEAAERIASKDVSGNIPSLGR